MSEHCGCELVDCPTCNGLGSRDWVDTNDDRQDRHHHVSCSRCKGGGKSINHSTCLYPAAQKRVEKLERKLTDLRTAAERAVAVNTDHQKHTLDYEQCFFCVLQAAIERSQG